MKYQPSTYGYSYRTTSDCLTIIGVLSLFQPPLAVLQCKEKYQGKAAMYE